MKKTDFIDKFGSIFEHSAWVAERAFDGLQDGPNLDAESLHQHMCSAFDNASENDRLEVLRAHPDLAGKLAQAKRLTPESTAEQASSGLDVLTDEERAIFTQLNTQYVQKFNFPFIICVRDYDKPSILAAFKQRVAGERSEEFITACDQVKRIAFHRLHAMFEA